MSQSGPETVAPEGAGRRFAVVAARYNGHIVDRLVEGAVECLLEHGVASGDVVVVRVPGAFELPLAARVMAERDDIDGVVALGVVIRGDTDHYKYVCKGATQGLMILTVQHRVPLGFGVLTCDDEEQALARAGGARGNKGRDAALAALEMVQLCGGDDPASTS